MIPRPQRDSRVEDLDDHRELTERERRQAEASAEAWTRWSSDIGVRLAALEARLARWLGEEGKGDDDDDSAPVIVQVVATIQDDIEKRASVESIHAMREEIQVEVALVRDELLSKIESRVFGVQLSEFDPDAFRRVVGDLKSEVAALVSPLAELAGRIDNVDKRRRSDRQAAKEALGEMLQKLDKLSAARATVLNKRIDDLNAKIDGLHNATAEAFEDQR